jgi:LytS/YehU family sensor histidine kinase
MLKTILAISGKPGLYRLVSRGNKMLIVETIDNAKKRMPAHSADKVVSLADISIYTDDDNEVSLASVFESIKEKYDGKAVELSAKKADQSDIISFFEKVLPNYDTDRVRVSDMRKVLAWYNLLINDGMTSFVEENEESAAE